MSSHAVTGRLVFGISEDITPQDDIFKEHPAGAYRGVLFAMLFNLLLIGCGAAVWLVLR